MKRQLYGVLGLVAFGALALIVATFLARVLGLAGSPPTVRVALGQTWDQVRSASNYPFVLTDRTRTGYAIQDQAVDFAYVDPARGFTLPAARTVWFQLDKEHVNFIFVMPFQRVLTWTEAAQLCDEIAARLDRAGWPRDGRYGLEQAREYYTNPTFANGPNDFAVQLWRDGDKTTELALYRNVQTRADAGNSTPERIDADRFSVSVTIEQWSKP
ncbi:MAG: hypothetical protein WCF84_14580 [Anaerolineae bacterium]